MKPSIYRLKCLIPLVFFTNSLFSQTYSFVYKFGYNNFYLHQNSIDADTGFKSLLNKLSVQVYGTYEIVSNGRYMIVKGKSDSSYSGNLRLHFSGEEAIIDIKKQLVYFPIEKNLQKIRSYSLADTSVQQGDCLKKFIKEKGNDVTVLVCKSLPKAISFPQIIFVNAKNGIKNILSPGVEITLISYKRINNDKRLQDCKKYFENKFSKKEFDFFSQ